MCVFVCIRVYVRGCALSQSMALFCKIKRNKQNHIVCIVSTLLYFKLAFFFRNNLSWCFLTMRAHLILFPAAVAAPGSTTYLSCFPPAVNLRCSLYLLPQRELQ